MHTDSDLAKAAVQQLLGDPPPDWMQSAGIGLLDGKKALYLYLTRKVKYNFPKDVNGMPLVVQVAGKVVVHGG